MKNLTSLFFLLVACVCFAQKPPTSPITFTPAKQLFKVVKNPNLTKEQQFRYDKILDRAEHDYMEVVEMDYLPNYIVPKTQALKLKVPALRHVQFPKLRSAQENIVLKAIRNEARTGNFNGNDNYVFYGAANPTISILTVAANPTISINTGGVVLPPNFPCPPFCITDNTDPQTNDVVAECRYADMTVIQSDNGSYGMIKIDQLAFQLFNLTDGLYALAKVNDDVIEAALPCGLDESKTMQSFENSLGAETIGLDDEMIENFQKSPSCVIDIAVLYTPAALAAYPDILDRADIANENANNALINSDLGDVSFNVVTYRLYDNPLFTNTEMFDDLLTLSVDSEAHCIREEEGADLVILLSGNTYGNSGYAFIGPNEPESFAIVRSNAMLEIRHTYAHELGHTLGCAHQTTSLEIYEPYARAHILAATPTCGLTEVVGTVVSVGGTGAQYRILHYSNPDANFWDAATGTVNNDNGRRIEETAPIVSNFRNSATAPANVSISSWQNTTCPCDYTFDLGATNIDTYEWTLYEQSSTGLYIQVHTSNNSSLNLDDYKFCSASTSYKIELTVTYNNGDCTNDYGPIYHTTGLIPPGPCQSLKNDGDESTGIVDYQESLTVYPNPSTDVVNVVLPEDLLEKNVELRLNNLSGQQMASIQIHDLQTLNQQLSFNQYNLANGIYILEVESDGKLMVQKVSVIR